MRIPWTEGLVEDIHNVLGPQEFYDEILRTIEEFRKPGESDKSLHARLSPPSHPDTLRGMLARLARKRDGKVLEISIPVALQIIRYLNFEATLVQPPWDALGKQSKLAIVRGIRDMTMPGSHRQANTLTIGYNDDQAGDRLVRLCKQRFNLECEFQMTDVGGSDDVETLLDDLINTQNVGMIIMIGSDIANPMAVPAAQKILEPKGSEKASVVFRREDNTNSFLSAPPSSGSGLPLEKEGLVLPGNIFHRRDVDDHIFQEIKDGTYYEDKLYHDYGILLLDCNRRPYLALGAGHGGDATIATILTLVDHREIGKLLSASHHPEKYPSSTGPNKIFAVVRADFTASVKGKGQKQRLIHDLKHHEIVWASTEIPAAPWANL